MINILNDKQKIKINEINIKLNILNTKDKQFIYLLKIYEYYNLNQISNNIFNYYLINNIDYNYKKKNQYLIYYLIIETQQIWQMKTISEI